MFSNQSTEFALEAPCRVVESIKADKLDNRFLVGSCHVGGASSSSSRSSYGEYNVDNSSNCSINYLYVMRFHSEVNELGLDVALPHEPGPIQAIASCPTDASLALTCTERSPQATLWKIPTTLDCYNNHEDHHHQHDVAGSGSLKPLVTLLPPPLSSSSASPASSADLADVVWRDDGHEDVSSTIGDVLTLDKSGTLTRWDISSATATPVRTVCSRGANKSSSSWANNNNAMVPPRVAWDPHANNGDAVAVTRGRAVDILDWRVGSDSKISAVPVGTVSSFSAHGGSGVIDLDYNPNKPALLATSGQDGLIKFWDLRSARRPLLVCTGGHSHWSWNVQYNPFHDQLVLSTGTDSMVNLWRVSSVSSAPLLTLNDDDEDDDDDNAKNESGAGGAGSNHHHHGGMMGKDENKDNNNNNNNNNNRNLSETAAHNVLVGRMEHTADACYGAAWGAADAWIYVTVGYDGKVVLSHVPSKEKYKILL